MRRLGCALTLAALAGCTAGPAEGTGLTLRDPLGVLDDVDGDLKLYVLGTEAPPYMCDDTTGTVEPVPIGDPVPGAVVDIDLPITGMGMSAGAMAMVNVDPGMYVVLVQGSGRDSASGMPFTATGCSTVMIDGGETRDVAIVLNQVFPPGECGDGFLSAEEQCDDMNTMSGDGCSDTCRTEEIPINNATTDRGQRLPSVGWADNQRALVAFDTEEPSSEINFRILGQRGEPITMPAALATDATIEMSPGIRFPGVQSQSAVAVTSGRGLVAFTDANVDTDTGDVTVAFIDLSNRAAAGTPVRIHDSPGQQTEPRIAATTDGNVLVVYQDSLSSTGISARHFPAGATTPDGAGPMELGQGSPGGATLPSVAGHGSGFVVAFSAGGDVFFQRVGSDGTPVDASAMPAVSGLDAEGTQDQATVAALSDGRFVVAWRDTGGDGAGTAIRSRAFGADGMPAGDVATVDTTTAGDQSLPAAGGGHDRFFIAWQSGSDIRARLLDGSGFPARNREPEPDLGDFLVAMGASMTPDVAVGGPAGENGFAIVVWQSTVVDRAGDIRGRVFAVP